MDYFIGYSIQDKLALLKGITESLLSGQIVRVRTSSGVETQFSPNVDNSLMYQRLCDSVCDDPNFDSTDPIQAACLSNQRVGITQPNFGGRGYGYPGSGYLT